MKAFIRILWDEISACYLSKCRKVTGLGWGEEKIKKKKKEKEE